MAKIPAMCECANYELNRRSRILHYRDGKINPGYLKEAFEHASQMNFTNDDHRKKYTENHWSPVQAILFGGEKALNITCVAVPCDVVTVTSQEDHLKISQRKINAHFQFIPDEIKGSPMNGIIIPHNQPSQMRIEMQPIKNILAWKKNSMSKIHELQKSGYPLKLTILISTDDNVIQEGAKSRALSAVEVIRKDLSSAPICVITQRDTRNSVRFNKDCRRKNLELDSYGLALMFYGHDVNASILLVDKKDNNETLKSKFELWKQKELLFLDSHQAVAFHFTVVNSTEPKNSEKIFSNTFPDIPLNTLRLLDESSMTGVNYKVGTMSDFYAGPVYAVVGFRKFGGRNPATENLSEENDWFL
ncbi:hypothetical protein LOAG_12904 [Loa loa]|nr:hypothetical protein LOAG_12904 [Loa loa]EFO15605.2 hypothetical protein LOAG_12904 [Loa loa]